MGDDGLIGLRGRVVSFWGSFLEGRVGREKGNEPAELPSSRTEGFLTSRVCREGAGETDGSVTKNRWSAWSWLWGEGRESLN